MARLKIMKAIKSGNIPVPKTKQQQNPGSMPDIPDDCNFSEDFSMMLIFFLAAGVKKMNDFQPHQSIINRGVNPQGTDSTNPYNNPYYQAPNNDNFGQGGGGLPDFGKFDNHASVKPSDNLGGGGLPDFLKFDNAPSGGTTNLNFGGTGMNIEPSNNYGGFGAQTKPQGTKVRRGADFYQKTNKAQDICKKALSELEYKRIRQFKENLETALEMLESLGE